MSIEYQLLDDSIDPVLDLSSPEFLGILDAPRQVERSPEDNEWS